MGVNYFVKNSISFCFLDPFPWSNLIRALDHSLNTLPGENPDQYVALMRKAGQVRLNFIHFLTCCFSQFSDAFGIKKEKSLEILAGVGKNTSLVQFSF